MRLTILAAGALLLPLAACNKGPSTEESARATGEIRLDNASMEEVSKQAVAAEGKAPVTQPGQWEETMQMIGLEAGSATEAQIAPLKAQVGKPPEKRTMCRAATDPKPFDVSKFPQMAQTCRFAKYYSVGGKVEAVMNCDVPGGKSSVSIAGTQNATAYDLTMKQSQTMTGQPKESSVTLRVTGKRLGECKI